MRSNAIGSALRARLCWLYLAAMVPLAGLYLVGPAVFHSGPLYNAMGFSSVAAIVAGLLVHRPAAKAPWIMFAIGIAWLWFTDGDASVNYFFGNILVDAAPSTRSFTQFKLVLFAAGALFSFVAPVIVLTPTPTTDVLPLAFKAAFANAPLLIFSLAISVGLELVMTPLGVFGYAGAALSLCVTVLSVMWGFVFAYVASSRVLGSS